MAQRTGLLHPTDKFTLQPDTFHVITTTAASSAYAVDLPSSTLGSSAICKYCEIKATVGGYITFGSTGAIYPSSNLTTSPSTGAALDRFLAGVPLQRQVPGGSTGYSFTIDSSGIFTAAFWGP